MENVGSFLFALVYIVVRMKHGFEFKSELAAHTHVRITDRVCFWAHTQNKALHQARWIRTISASGVVVVEFLLTALFVFGFQNACWQALDFKNKMNLHSSVHNYKNGPAYWKDKHMLKTKHALDRVSDLKI